MPPYGPALTAQHGPRHAAQFLSNQDGVIQFGPRLLGQSFWTSFMQCVRIGDARASFFQIRLNQFSCLLMFLISASEEADIILMIPSVAPLFLK